MVTWDERARIDDELVIRATQLLLDYLAANPGASAADVTEVVAGLSDTFGAATAASAYQALRTSRETWGQWDLLPKPSPARPALAEQVAAATAWALQTRNPEPTDPDDARARLTGVLGRMVRQPGRDTVIHATASAGTRFVRVPGAKACHFCLMLASRGAVYYTKKQALAASGTRGPRPEGLRYHDGCNCRAIESYSAADVPGIVHDLQQEWADVTHDADGLPLPDQRGLWRAHIRETRPTGTTLLPRNELPRHAARPALTEQTMRHILDGEPNNPRAGGHRSGTGRLGKTEFPATWSDETIRRVVEQTMASPQWSQVAGTAVTARRLVDDVVVEVRFTTGSGRRAARVTSAYPRSGTGVVRNDRTQGGAITPTAMPLDPRLLEE